MDTGELFKKLTEYDPYDYQKRAWAQIEKIMCEGGKVVIEVPTAGGKTEAAVMPFLVEAYNGTWAVSRLIYVLPTRSLVEKQAERIRKLVAKLLQLRGKSKREAEELAEKLVVVEYGLEPTHAFLGWVVVTTWDAFLYGLAAHRTIGSRFTFPAGAIAQSLVVLDEVQMYQDESLYMPRLLSLVVEQLEKANVPVVIMSATIPTELRKMIAGEAEIVGVEEEDRYKPQRGRVDVKVHPGTLEDVLSEIKAELKAGKRVLIVRNTVDRAIETYRKLLEMREELGVEPLLIHGRFTVEDRKKKEKALDSAKLIVATQVVEAGLDLPNIGLVITDIAPLDALIQRIGRCARRPNEEGKAIVLIQTEPVEKVETILGFSDIKEGQLFATITYHKEYGRVVEVHLEDEGKAIYIGDMKTLEGLGKKKRLRDLYILPYLTAPYDPLTLLLTYDELGNLEEHLYSVDKAREALDRVYRFHYANNIVPREFYSAYVYFRELKLFSAPPEYELRSRPELYVMLYVPNETEEKHFKLNRDRIVLDFELNTDRIIRVSYSMVRNHWDNIKGCILGELVREWKTDSQMYLWTLRKDFYLKPLAIYAISRDCYTEEGFLFRRKETTEPEESESAKMLIGRNPVKRSLEKRRPKVVKWHLTPFRG
ncbi:CRISPR-associated helicase Cas3' [Pyrococcus kukulkanii]|uniref:CRISPR-associated helicase Cas3' n=1 Tax=Pyrococcus kukulkanii TaxID=1609559 RepID=UPI0009434E58|nr:CRISPR-associated helicase Cas3' [Pyrococcus kukulkanii]